jgi:uncharacterized protein (DUF983 family)
MVGRALRRRCPRCGGQSWFTGWFAKGERCVSCGYKPERQEGFMLGALAINTILTFGVMAVVIVIGIIVGWPDIAVLPVMLSAMAAGVFVPMIIYPFTYLIWAVIDLSMRPLEPQEEADALTWLAAQRGPDAAAPGR